MENDIFYTIEEAEVFDLNGNLLPYTKYLQNIEVKVIGNTNGSDEKYEFSGKIFGNILVNNHRKYLVIPNIKFLTENSVDLKLEYLEMNDFDKIFTTINIEELKKLISQNKKFHAVGTITKKEETENSFKQIRTSHIINITKTHDIIFLWTKHVLYKVV